MFSKQAVCIATAAGAGMRSAIKDMTDSMFFWGVAKTYKYGVAVRETSYARVDEKIKRKIDRRTTALAGEIIKNRGRVHAGWKTKIFFHMMRMLQKMGWNEADCTYWKEKGWSGKKRPWK